MYANILWIGCLETNVWLSGLLVIFPKDTFVWPPKSAHVIFTFQCYPSIRNYIGNSFTFIEIRSIDFSNINECSSTPCENGASCSDQINGYTCTSVAGYTGILCQTSLYISRPREMNLGASMHIKHFSELYACWNKRVWISVNFQLSLKGILPPRIPNSPRKNKQKTQKTLKNASNLPSRYVVTPPEQGV